MNATRPTLSATLFALATAIASIASAQTRPHSHDHGTTASQPSRAAGTDRNAASPNVDGEVRKIERDAGKLTLRHGPIPNLEMDAMTMVFRVADPKLLDGLQVGDKLRFRAERIDGLVTVTAVQPAR